MDQEASKTCLGIQWVLHKCLYTPGVMETKQLQQGRVHTGSGSEFFTQTSTKKCLLHCAHLLCRTQRPLGVDLEISSQIYLEPQKLPLNVMARYPTPSSGNCRMHAVPLQRMSTFPHGNRMGQQVSISKQSAGRCWPQRLTWP